jgi:CheY-like chemotaxis protein
MAVMELDCLDHQPIPSTGLASAIVLVADSNPDELELMALILEGCGYKMLPAQDRETALRLVERCRPLLVFTELMLPILDGIAIAQRLRQQANFVPLIAVTTLPINLVRPSIFQNRDDGDALSGTSCFFTLAIYLRKRLSALRIVSTSQQKISQVMTMA